MMTSTQKIIGVLPLAQRITAVTAAIAALGPDEEGILALAMAIIALPGGEMALRTAVFEASGKQ